MLAFSNIWFPLFFGSLLVGYAVVKRDASILAVADEPAQRSLFRKGSLMQLACFTGLANILNGYGISASGAVHRAGGATRAGCRRPLPSQH